MTGTAVGTCESLGRLLQYPDEDFSEQLGTSLTLLARENPEAARSVRQFAAGVENLALQRLQELFTQTFDLNPQCSLEVGYQIWGEEYARGSFLVFMREELRNHGIEESTELPDHLTHVLPLIDRTVPDDGKELRELAEVVVLPAMKKMMQGLQGKENPYEFVLRAVEEVLRARQVSATAKVSHE